MLHYDLKVSSTVKAIIPDINNNQKMLIIVERMFNTLLFSAWRTQIIESNKPTRINKIFVPAHTVCIPFVSVTPRNVGINVARGSRLKTNAHILRTLTFFFFILNYLISFFPKALIDTVKTSTNTIIAHGKNGMSSNVESEETAVKSCNEQDTRYPL